MIGIDVSTYNGNINWKTVKSSGIDFAILKVINKSNKSDSKFEQNWKGCEDAGLTIQGVYNYSYATNVAKARLDANAVLSVLNGRRAMVWLDVEDNCQKGLKRALIDIILAYKDVIEKAGLQFGVYTGESFYNTQIKPYLGALNITFWIAKYGKNNGLKDATKQPQVKNMIGWQYTSKGVVKGVPGLCDVNEWYKDLDKIPVKETFYAKYREPERVLYYKKYLSMYGEDVKWVQDKLIRKNCLSVTNSKGKSNIDGVFGKDTDKAVRLFQGKEKIKVDGIVGLETRTHLKA